MGSEDRRRSRRNLIESCTWVWCVIGVEGVETGEEQVDLCCAVYPFISTRSSLLASRIGPLNLETRFYFPLEIIEKYTILFGVHVEHMNGWIYWGLKSKGEAISH